MIDSRKPVEPEMIEIPPGGFLMGAPASEEGSFNDERPQHMVTLASFYIGKFAVTQEEWRVVADLPSFGCELKPDPSHFKGDDRPVESVSWHEAKEFCARLSNATGKPYRLPTEAEWEYACRAGTETPFAFGETITPDLVNYDGNYPYGGAAKGKYRRETVAVGSLGVANGYGLYDMHGNVWEWCEDRYGSYEEGAVTDPVGPGTGKYRVLRGGSWDALGCYCRSACRDYLQPAFHYLNVGFRVAYRKI